MDEQGQGQKPEDILASIESSIGNARAKIKESLRNRKGFFIIAAILILFLVLHYSNTFILGTILLVLLWILAIFFLLAGVGTSPEKFESELERLQSLKKIYFGDLDSSTQSTYFDSLVKINIENLGDYYRLVKVHTKESFRLAAIAGLAVGFLRQDLQNLSYLSSASGIVIEFISGVFFYLYNKTVRQLKGYHDSLLDVQNILLSFKLIESTQDEKEKSVMIQKMIEFLVGKKRDVLSPVLPAGAGT